MIPISGKSDAAMGAREKTGLTAQLSHARWRPIAPPQPGLKDRHAFHVSLLLPGIAHAFHAQVLNLGLTTIGKYLAAARAAFLNDPHLREAVDDAARGMTPADGLLMARLRGPCQLPFWSRLAIVQYRKEGHSIPELAEVFICSPRTIVNAIKRSDFTSAERRLSQHQENPPGKFKPRAAQERLAALRTSYPGYAVRKP